jgi:hypothetical protein
VSNAMSFSLSALPLTTSAAHFPPSPLADVVPLFVFLLLFSVVVKRNGVRSARCSAPRVHL